MNFVFRGDELLVQDESMNLPDAQVCTDVGLTADKLQFVWLAKESPCRTAQISRDNEPPLGFSFVKLRALLGVLPDELMAQAGRAFQIAEWARTHQFCGACGTPTLQLETEHCMRCPSCGLSAYPRISPAMMVLIKKGDQILLARHAGNPNARYTALAGFVEPGESLEDTIHREVFEEVGLRVQNLQYFGSQPWPFPHSLMVAYTADYLSGDIQIQEDEIVDAQWFNINEPLPPIPGKISISGWLIRANIGRE